MNPYGRLKPDDFCIRHARTEDAKRLYEIESASYPKEEGASLNSIQERIRVFGDCFWILEKNGQIISFINGMKTDQSDLTDDLYEEASLHTPQGKWQMIFSVATDPAFRKQGMASAIMKQVIEDSRLAGVQGIVLTCKEQLLDFYGKFGFVSEGISASQHGGAKWCQMRLLF